MRTHPLFPIVATVAMAVAVAAGATPALAEPDAATPAISPRHHLDPGLPPAATRAAAQARRRAAREAGAPTLDAQVEAKLRASFDAADVARQGTLTRAQAQVGGFGFIAQHFDAIDTRHAGAVSFDDLTRYLRARDAAKPGASVQH